MAGCAVDKGLAQYEGILLKRKNVVGEHDDLVLPLLFVVSNKEVRGHKLVGVHGVQKVALGGIR